MLNLYQSKCCVFVNYLREVHAHDTAQVVRNALGQRNVLVGVSYLATQYAIQAAHLLHCN